MRVWRRWSGAVITTLLALAAPSCGNSVVETPGGQGGGGQGGGGAASCPDSICDDQNPCTADSCGPGEVCTYDPAPMEGMKMSDGATGNCRSLACHQGVAEAVEDDSDLPAAASPCTVGSCYGGTPTQMAVPNGISCTVQGNPGTCQYGQCKASECECPMPGPCQAASCDASTNQCVLTAVPDGTLAPGDFPGDCNKMICLGGQPAAVPDDTDVPPSSNPCLTTGCVNGNPDAKPLPTGAVCPFMGNLAGVCDGMGLCVQCVVNANCGPNQVCTNGHCQ